MELHSKITDESNATMVSRRKKKDFDSDHSCSVLDVHNVLDESTEMENILFYQSLSDFCAFQDIGSIIYIKTTQVYNHQGTRLKRFG